jgi:outer membrane protein assembly factor BamE
MDYLGSVKKGGDIFSYDIPPNARSRNPPDENARERLKSAFGTPFRFFSFPMTDYLHRPVKRMNLSRFASAVLLASIFSGCSSVPRLVTEYRIDVQQGNVVTQEMASQLRPGLSKDQVRFVLGTPMLIDMFHADRWDYVYRLQKGNSVAVDQRQMSVFFDPGGKLLRVEGDVEAAQSGEASVVPESRSRVIDLGSLPDDGRVSAPPLEEKGIFRKMMESVGL